MNNSRNISPARRTLHDALGEQQKALAYLEEIVPFDFGTTLVHDPQYLDFGKCMQSEVY